MNDDDSFKILPSKRSCYNRAPDTKLMKFNILFNQVGVEGKQYSFT